MNEYIDVTDPNEILPPDYQAWLDSLPAPTEEELEQMANVFEQTSEIEA